MCGIFGYLAVGEINDNKKLFSFLSALARKSEIRGSDATGFSAFYKRKDASKLLPGYVTDKLPLKASQFINMSANFNRLAMAMPSSFIGHTRASTGSANIINNNNHPFYGKKWDLVHNGSVINWQEKAKNFELDCRSFTDSETYLRFLEKNGIDSKPSDEMPALFGSMDDKIGQNYALSLLNKHNGDVWLLRNEKPTVLFHTTLFGDMVYVWASTESIIREAAESEKIVFSKEFRQVEKSGTETKKHHAYKLSLETTVDELHRPNHCIYYEIPIVNKETKVYKQQTSHPVTYHEMVYSSYNFQTKCFVSYASNRPPIDGMTREQFDVLDDISEKINSLLGNDCYDTQIYGSAAWLCGGI